VAERIALRHIRHVADSGRSPHIVRERGILELTVSRLPAGRGSRPGGMMFYARTVERPVSRSERQAGGLGGQPRHLEVGRLIDLASCEDGPR